MGDENIGVGRDGCIAGNVIDKVSGYTTHLQQGELQLGAMKHVFNILIYTYLELILQSISVFTGMKAHKTVGLHIRHDGTCEKNIHYFPMLI